jgi:hypothetical protein
MLKRKNEFVDDRENTVRGDKCQYTRPTLKFYGKAETITMGTNRKGSNIDSANKNCNELGLCYS